MSTDLHSPAAAVAHSANVDLILHVGSSRFSVLQTCNNEIKVADPQAIPLGDATLETLIDGKSLRDSIRILGPAARRNWLAIVDH